MISIDNIPGFAYYSKFQTSMVNKLVWPYPIDDELIRWRATILFSILFGGLILGSIAFAGALSAIISKGAWGIAVADAIGIAIGLILLKVHKIRFEIRASITCLLFFFIGVIVISSIGPQIGGPAWLFGFSVLSGVLMGSFAAFNAILINTFFLIVIGIMVTTGRLEFNMPYFSTSIDMLASVTNFIIVNSITAITVSTLLRAISEVYKKNKQLAVGLQQEKKELLLTKNKLEEKIEEKELAEQELRVKNLVFESAITANSISDAQGLLISVNNTFVKLWGYEKREDVLGRPIAQFFKTEQQAVRVISSLNEKSVWEGEFTALRKDGSSFTAYGLATTINDDSENITGYQSSVVDISDRLKAENDKIEAQKIAGEREKLALVGQISGKMAHDFNNVLGIIMGRSELALMECDDAAMKSTFELIFNQSLRGKNLTKNLIAFAKNSEPKHEFFLINEKLELVLNLLKSDLDGIEILRAESEQIEILADPGMIEHTLVNLIQNSIHAIHLTNNPQIIFRLFVANKTAVIEIEDNGCGIPEEYIGNIYDPSFSLKGGQDVHGKYRKGTKGTGYGLANVKKCIELHNGHITTTSKFDFGTKVTITLPLTKKKLSYEEKIKVKKEDISSRKKILLVEDEAAISEVQQQILTQSPFNHYVKTATNGKIAIELYKQNQYDLISLDYMLPGRLNGIDVYNYIREDNESIPILFISGNIEFLESIEILKTKDSKLSHLSKPCTNVDYINGINKLFEKMAN